MLWTLLLSNEAAACFDSSTARQPPWNEVRVTVSTQKYNARPIDQMALSLIFIALLMSGSIGEYSVLRSVLALPTVEPILPAINPTLAIRDLVVPAEISVLLIT